MNYKVFTFDDMNGYCSEGISTYVCACLALPWFDSLKNDNMRYILSDLQHDALYSSSPAGLRTIVNAILKSMKMLGEVVLLILFCIAVFALLALQLYKGVLKQKCVLDIPTEFNYCNVTHPGSEFGPLCFNSAETLQNYWLLQSTNYLYDSEGEAVMCSLQATSEGDIA